MLWQEVLMQSHWRQRKAPLRPGLSRSPHHGKAVSLVLIVPVSESAAEQTRLPIAIENISTSNGLPDR